MLTILYWTTHKNAVDENLIRLINRWQVDVFVLAESTYDPKALVNHINPRTKMGRNVFTPVAAQKPDAKVQLYSRLPRTRAKWQPKFFHARYEAWTFQQGGETVLLAAVHFPEIKYEQGDGQRKTAIELRQDVESYEKKFLAQNKGTKKIPLSLLIGDFNASPFDVGIAGFYGLNASAHRDIVEKQGERILGGQTVKFYYNPMWRFLGNPGTPGTFYARLSAPVSYDWFILDQMLLSPGLLDYVKDEDVRILDWDTDAALGGFPLTHRYQGNPLTPVTTISDHLPILVRIAL